MDSREPVAEVKDHYANSLIEGRLSSGSCLANTVLGVTRVTRDPRQVKGSQVFKLIPLVAIGLAATIPLAADQTRGLITSLEP